MPPPECCTLITGASSGIGSEVAIRLSRSRRLLLHGRDMARLQEARNSCVRPGEHVLWPLDLRDTGGIENSLQEFLLANNLVVECFIHCAGVLRLLPMRDVRPQMAAEIMAVNALSAAEIVRLLLKKKINSLSLRNVVFVSSTASVFGAKGFNLYCASKGALDSLMRALAVELAPTVRVNSVLPGAIRTRMTETMFQDASVGTRLAADYPLGIGTASDVASAVEFLVSEQARWITGQQVVVDGGRTVNITA